MAVAIPPTYALLQNFLVSYNHKNRWVNLYNIVPIETVTRDKPTEGWSCNWEFLVVGMWHPVHQILTLLQIKEYNFLHSFFFLLFLISTWYVNIRNSLIKKKGKKKISYTHFESQAQLCKRQLALTQGYISTQVSYFFYPKHPLSLFSVVVLEYPIIKLQAKWIKLNLLFRLSCISEFKLPWVILTQLQLEQPCPGFNL